MNIDELKHAWEINNKINLELLHLCHDDDLELKPGKGKTIRSNFVHIVGVRNMCSKHKIKLLQKTFQSSTGKRHPVRKF